jgi:hypothetical protein
MKQSIERRLLLLEQAHARGRDEQGRTPVQMLLERRKRRLEASGEPYVEPPRSARIPRRRKECPIVGYWLTRYANLSFIPALCFSEPGRSGIFVALNPWVGGCYAG